MVFVDFFLFLVLRTNATVRNIMLQGVKVLICLNRRKGNTIFFCFRRIFCILHCNTLQPINYFRYAATGETTMPVGVSATGTKNESKPGNEHPARPPVRSIYGSCPKRSLEVAGGERSRRWTELSASLMSGYEAFAFVKRDFLLYKAHGAWFFIKDFTTFGVFKTICRLRYA